MPFLKNPVAHFPQRADGDCLAACAAMALNYVDVRPSYRRLLRTLGTKRDAGTPFSNIRNLNKFGVTVIYDVGTFAMLHQHIENDSLCIVSVDTGELPHWNYATPHAVVVVGVDNSFVYIHDPDLPSGPTIVSIGDFDLAWLEGDELFAAIHR